jgi:hypothetical protein
MKQKIYTLGLVTTLVVVLGLLLKLNHYPGAGIVTTIGMALLILVFLPLALVNHYRNDGENRNLSLYIVTWITCLVIFTSMLFKLMHWPGAGYLLIIAIPFPFVVFLPVFLVVTSRIKNFNIYNTVCVLFLLAGLSLFTALLGLNVTKSRIDDSLNLSLDYYKVEKALDRIAIKGDPSLLGKRIDEVLTVVNEYQNRIYSSMGSSEEEWKNNPEKFAGIASAMKNRLYLNINGKTTDTRLEEGLRKIIGELDATPGCEALSKSAPEIFSIGRSSEKPGEWSKAVLENGNGTWILIYLNGLEVNLKMIKASIK